MAHTHALDRVRDLLTAVLYWRRQLQTLTLSSDPFAPMIMTTSRTTVAVMKCLFLVALFWSPLVAGFSILPPTRHSIHQPLRTIHKTVVVPTTTALGSGFGGGDKKKKKEVKIKPKQQWDRYSGDLKKEKPYRVAVKAEGRKSDEWLEVGNVKSKDGEYTKAAVARQRALIVEHARRLFPLQVSTKDKIEWAYWDAENEDWILCDKSVLEESDLPDGLEKLIGFEGRPDPASGFYCMYNEGTLVTGDDDLKRSSSKKLK